MSDEDGVAAAGATLGSFGCRCNSPTNGIDRRSGEIVLAPSRPHEYDWVVRLGGYEDPLRAWLLAIKHRRWAAMASWLGARLAEQCAGTVDLWDRRDVVIVPVPMPRWRRWGRGIDHTRLMAMALGAALRTELNCGEAVQTAVEGRLGAVSPSVRVREALWRGPVRPQAGRTAAGRRRHGRSGFGVCNSGRWRAVVAESLGLGTRARWTGWGLDGATAIVVDDVLTTGTTAEMAATLLRTLGATEIGVAVVAVADFGRNSLNQRPKNDVDGSAMGLTPPLVSL